MSYYPAICLSAAGNHDEFGIPTTPLGDAVCQLRLVWARVDGAIQPAILHPSVHYPNFEAVDGKEVYSACAC